MPEPRDPGSALGTGFEGGCTVHSAESAATDSLRDNPPINGYVDIHAHLLPGIDDGPPDLAQSLLMARMAAESGIDTIAATPHLGPDFPAVHADELADRCLQLRAELEGAGLRLRVLVGAEVSLAWALDASDEQLRLASYDQRGSDLLIEIPSGHVVDLDRFIYQLRAKGYRITLAHPERNLQFQRDADPLRALADQGVLLQLNAESLIARRRARGVARLARELLITGLAHVIASDAHRAEAWRPVTHLARAANVAAELIGADRARWMTDTAPRAITRGDELPTAPAISRTRERPRLFGH